MKFRNKPKIIDAEQFTDPSKPPRGVLFGLIAGGQGFFVLTAQCVSVPVLIGEWIVDEGDGRRFYPIADDVFKGPKGYEPV